MAIPTSLIDQNDKGQLEFLFYVQVVDGFISIEDLQLAVEVYLMDSRGKRIAIKGLCMSFICIEYLFPLIHSSFSF